MDPKQIIAKSRTTAKRTASKSLRTAKRTAVKTGAAGPIYRAANKAVVTGDRTLARARRVTERKLDERGLALETNGRPRLRRLRDAERDPTSLPEALSVIPADLAEGILELPPRINWSDPHRIFDLSNDEDRAEAYALILRSGDRIDIEDHIDGARLAAMWDDLVLPASVRERFAPLVAKVR